MLLEACHLPLRCVCWVGLEGTSCPSIKDLPYDHKPNNFLVRKVILLQDYFPNFKLRKVLVSWDPNTCIWIVLLLLINCSFFFDNILISLSLFSHLPFDNVLFFLVVYWYNQIVTNCPQIQCPKINLVHFLLLIWNMVRVRWGQLECPI